MENITLIKNENSFIDCTKRCLDKVLYYPCDIAKFKIPIDAIDCINKTQIGLIPFSFSPKETACHTLPTRQPYKTSIISISKTHNTSKVTLNIGTINIGSQFSLKINDKYVTNTYYAKIKDNIHSINKWLNNQKLIKYTEISIDENTIDVYFDFNKLEQICIPCNGVISIDKGALIESNTNTPSITKQFIKSAKIPSYNCYELIIDDDIIDGNIYSYNGITYTALDGDTSEIIKKELGITDEVCQTTKPIIVFSKGTFENENTNNYKLVKYWNKSNSNASSDKDYYKLSIKNLVAGNILQIYDTNRFIEYTVLSSDNDTTIDKIINPDNSIVSGDTNTYYALKKGESPSINVIKGTQTIENKNNPNAYFVFSKVTEPYTEDSYYICFKDFKEGNIIIGNYAGKKINYVVTSENEQQAFFDIFGIESNNNCAVIKNNRDNDFKLTAYSGVIDKELSNVTLEMNNICCNIEKYATVYLAIPKRLGCYYLAIFINNSKEPSYIFENLIEVVGKYKKTILIEYGDTNETLNKKIRVEGNAFDFDFETTVNSNFNGFGNYITPSLKTIKSITIAIKESNALKHQTIIKALSANYVYVDNIRYILKSYDIGTANSKLAKDKKSATITLYDYNSFYSNNKSSCFSNCNINATIIFADTSSSISLKLKNSATTKNYKLNRGEAIGVPKGVYIIESNLELMSYNTSIKIIINGLEIIESASVHDKISLMVDIGDVVEIYNVNCNDKCISQFQTIKTECLPIEPNMLLIIPIQSNCLTKSRYVATNSVCIKMYFTIYKYIKSVCISRNRYIPTHSNCIKILDNNIVRVISTDCEIKPCNECIIL